MRIQAFTIRIKAMTTVVFIYLGITLAHSQITTASAADQTLLANLLVPLRADAELSTSNVDVLVGNGVVTLRGDVPSAIAQEDAEQIAATTSGVSRVISQLTVKPPAQVQDFLSYAKALSSSGVTTKNLEHAASIYSMLANRGVLYAQQSLAFMNLFDSRFDRNPVAAVQFLRQAASQRDSWAITTLAGCYRRGDGVEWDEQKAMSLFRIAANANYAPAQSELGRGLMNGLGHGKQDYTEAAYWFDRAIQQGDQAAKLQLGYLYERGWGVTQNLGTSRLLYEDAYKSIDTNIRKAAQQQLASLTDMERRRTQASDEAGTAAVVLLGAVAAAALLSSSLPSATQKPEDVQNKDRKTCQLDFGVSSSGDKPNYNAGVHCPL